MCVCLWSCCTGFCGNVPQNQKLCFHPRKLLAFSGKLHGAPCPLLTSSFSTLVKRVCPNALLKPLSSVESVRFMPTLNQIRRSKPRTKNSQPKKYVPRAERIMLGPQRKGVCVKVFVRKPKKPNSAQRKCALLRLSSGKTITAYIQGQKGQLQEHGVVLFEGGRVQDCPGIQYKIVRGKLDMN